MIRDRGPVPIPTEETRKKRKKGISPVQRSLASLRENGWTVCSVEKWIPPRGVMKFGVRIDAFGFGDLLACRPAIADLPPMIALVQCTSDNGGNVAAHRTKILALPEFGIWKRAGGRVLLQGWAKKGPRGKKKYWIMREIEL